MNKFEKISKQRYFIDTEKHFEPNCWADEVHATEEYENIKLPKRATTGSAGYDFYAPYDITILPRQSVKVPTGIRVILDDDKFLAIYPRSGLGFKYKMQLFNSVGIVDSDYSQSDNEGHIWAKFYNDSPDGKTIIIKQGEAMCQGIIQQFFKTVDDEADALRNGGFGSSDRKC